LFLGVGGALPMGGGFGGLASYGGGCEYICKFHA
ncbi:unnamed protein product, partial [Rotaria sp. Silwood1]